MTLRAIDLFAGMGGFGLAAQQAGAEVVYANEFDPYAADLHDANFDAKVDRRSIVEVEAGDVPEHDLMTMGFPCQTFSRAGSGLGFLDERGKMFPEGLRIAVAHRTPLIVAENVKGLVGHDKGRTLETILRWLKEAGYGVNYRVLSSWDHAGIPQSRERIYLVAALGREVPDSVFPERPEGFPRLGATAAWRDFLDPAETIPQNYWYPPGSSMYDKFVAHFESAERDSEWWMMSTEGGLVPVGPARPEEVVVKQHLAHRFREHGFVPTLMANGDSSSGKVPMAFEKVYKFHRANELRNHDMVPTMMANMGTGGGKVPMVLDDGGPDVFIPRKFTERECARLQGFPDSYVLDVVSPTRQFKAIGNAVTVPVAEAVIHNAIRLIA